MAAAADASLAGLLAVGLVLLAVFRRAERALVPLVPIALATGWSALVLYATRVPLNPMSATLGALVIAISTEFSVLLSERFRQERAAGHELAAALARTYRSTGRAVLASGVTAIAGFGVLAFSDIRMLRDFGIVTVVDLTVSLLGVLVVLPSVLVLAERRRAAAGSRCGAAGARSATRRRTRRRRSRERAAGRRAAQAAAGTIVVVVAGEPLGLDRRRGRVDGARLHHLQHAQHERARLAGTGARQPPAAVRRAARGQRPRRRRERRRRVATRAPPARSQPAR